MVARLVLLCLALSTILTGCDRTPIEQIGPDLRIVAPDLSRALTTPTITVRVEAARGSDVESVRVNGVPAERSGDVFTTRLTVDQVGIVPLEVVASDASGAETTLRESALYLPYSYTFLPLLDTLAVGEHAAGKLPGPNVLVTGGVSSPGGEATADAFVISGALTAVPVESMASGRAGHTLTALPDGRLLVLGGATRAIPEGFDQLVETAEVFDPDLGRFLPVVLELRDPIQRAQHTTAAVPLENGDVALYLTGGVGRSGSRGGAPAFDVISTQRRLRYVPGGPDDGGRLVQDGLDPRDGPRAEYFTGHAEADVSGVPGVRALVGAKDSLDGFADASFRSVYGAQTRDGRLFRLDALGGVVRSAHAGAPGPTGLAVFMGGRRPGMDSAQPIASTEVYADGPRRRYLLPEHSDLQIARWGHSATSYGDGRILVIGGFGADDQTVDAVELFGPR